MSIGDNTFIGDDTLVTGGDVLIRIGRNVGIGPRCLIVNGTHEIGDSTQRTGKGYSESIEIGDGSMICAHSTILGGVSIGRGCVVAAGSLVRKDIDDNCMVAGVPAQVIRELPS